MSQLQLHWIGLSITSLTAFEWELQRFKIPLQPPSLALTIGLCPLLPCCRTSRTSDHPAVGAYKIPWSFGCLHTLHLHAAQLRHRCPLV